MICSITIILDFILLLGLCACLHSPALLQDIKEDNLQFWDRSQDSRLNNNNNNNNKHTFIYRHLQENPNSSGL